jgi:hypothetical protein
MTTSHTQPRRWIAAAVAAVLLASAGAPHHHTDKLQELQEYLGNSPTTPYHEVACKTPSETHWHADRIHEPEPCLACQRVHFVGQPSNTGSATVLTGAVLGFRAPETPVLSADRRGSSSRAPPISLLAITV